MARLGRDDDDAGVPPPAELDPDAVGLPPGAELPEAKRYRRDQLKALLLTNVAALAVVALLWKIGTPYPRAVLTCMAILVLFFFVNLYRWASAKR